MNSHSFVAGLKKHLTPANKKLLDAIADSPVVVDLIERAEATEVADRRKLVAERALIPGQLAKALKPAVAEAERAAEEKRAAEAAFVAARARESLTSQIAHGIEVRFSAEDARLAAELRAGAGNLVNAAARAVSAFCVAQYCPDAIYALAPRPPAAVFWDPRAAAEYDAVLAEVNSINRQGGDAISRAETAQRVAAAALDELKLQAQTESESAEAISSILLTLTEACAGLKGNPRFIVDENMDVVVKFGAYDEQAFKIKTTEASK